MKELNMALVVGTLISGLWAAWCWYKASNISVDPGWETEPGDPLASQMDWTSGIIEAVLLSARLNKVAALWTAITVMLGAICSIMGNLR